MYRSTDRAFRLELARAVAGRVAEWRAYGFQRRKAPEGIFGCGDYVAAVCWARTYWEVPCAPSEIFDPHLLQAEDFVRTVYARRGVWATVTDIARALLSTWEPVPTTFVAELLAKNEEGARASSKPQGPSKE